MPYTHGRRQKSPSRQKGSMLIGAFVATLLVAILSMWYARNSISLARTQSGEAVGQQLRELNDALAAYVTDGTRAKALLNSQPITSVVNPYAPTVAELQALGLFAGSMPATPFNGGSYSIAINKKPAGCSPSSCTLTTSLWLSNPVLDSHGKVDSEFLFAIMARLQGKAGFTMKGISDVRASGMMFANPDPAGRAGILLLVNREDSNSDYFLIQDNRDPNLQGDITVAGYLGLGSTATQGAACAKANQIGRSNSAESMLLICTSGTWKSAAGLDTLATAGGSCTSGQIGKDAAGFLFTCQGGIWRAVGLSTVAAGQACTTMGTISTDTNGVAFICRGGIYQPLANLLASSVEMSRIIVSDASTNIAKPICGTNGNAIWDMTPIAVSLDLSTSHPYASLLFSATDLGNAWQPRISLITDVGATQSGNNFGLTAVFKSYCSFTR